LIVAIRSLHRDNIAAIRTALTATPVSLPGVSWPGCFYQHNGIRLDKVLGRIPPRVYYEVSYLPLFSPREISAGECLEHH